MSQENWLPVVGFESNYEVSDLGRVRSIVNNHGNPRQRLLKPQLTHDGYLRVALTVRGEKTKKHIAHMVLEAFVGARPVNMQACHGVKGSDRNELSNLRWDTPEANYADRDAAGFIKGERHWACSITEDVAHQIRLAGKTKTAADLATQFGVSLHIVNNIRTSKTWRSA